ncbi:MAG TPA: hypothetical protein PLB73_18005 [Leptospiraceae bacterium]|nr:hypothetical protein [Leptospiraceae bacterium]
MSILLTIALVGCILALFFPLLRSRSAPEYYVGAPQDERIAETRAQLQSVLAELRQDFDAGKLSEEEFSQMATPLANRLDSLTSIPAPSRKKAISSNRQSCAVCGYLGAPFEMCPQCGTEVKQ